MAHITTTRTRSTCEHCGERARTRTVPQRLAFLDRHSTAHVWRPEPAPGGQPRHGWPTWAIAAGATLVAVLTVVL